ncbi:hypothetical protein C2845_PM02G26590 [Panicum miliaceum]|uniref:Uncharacterized protein n=1 Tax=Panicum miliaceum TaxID=4540 RepID=A0A3L6S9F0_PANMI|nr:hypothetical protein C2845_PM02G26590 [Panicum miliaceum]
MAARGSAEAVVRRFPPSPLSSLTSLPSASKPRPWSTPHRRSLGPDPTSSSPDPSPPVRIWSPSVGVAALPWWPCSGRSRWVMCRSPAGLLRVAPVARVGVGAWLRRRRRLPQGGPSSRARQVAPVAWVSVGAWLRRHRHVPRGGPSSRAHQVALVAQVGVPAPLPLPPLPRGGTSSRMRRARGRSVLAPSPRVVEEEGGGALTARLPASGRPSSGGLLRRGACTVAAFRPRGGARWCLTVSSALGRERGDGKIPGSVCGPMTTTLSGTLHLLEGVILPPLPTPR